MPRNDFHSDDAWQRSVRDTILVPQFYERRNAGRYVLMDRGRLATMLQRRHAVDTIVQAKCGGVVAIEEKIVRWRGRPLTAYALETHSCTVPGHESPGWMHYGEADYLLYAFQQADESLDCHLLDFPELRVWFAPREESFPTFQMPTRNRTRGRVVRFSAVPDSLLVARFSLARPVREAAE